MVVFLSVSLSPNPTGSLTRRYSLQIGKLGGEDRFRRVWTRPWCKCPCFCFCFFTETHWCHYFDGFWGFLKSENGVVSLNPPLRG